MNNLKRILSLLLAVVMVVGVMAVASATAFPDDKDIEHKEAVGTMVALNIIKGKDDGEYHPDDLVTRAEMAKMIFVALNGGRDNSNLTKLATPTYTDIKGNWAEGYIEYVSALKIIAGRGDGTFDPNGNVTGQEAAKMLLIAIGYDPEVEKLQGTADWGINADSLAFGKGFYDHVAITTGAALNRDDAAQIILDACRAEMVKYTYQLSANNGLVESKPILEGRGYSLLEDKYELISDAPSVLRSVSLITDGVNEGKYTITTAAQTYTPVAEDYSALLGQQVTVLGVSDGARTPAVKTNSVYGIFATDLNSIDTVNQSALSSNSSLDANGAATITDGVYNATLVTNFVNHTSYDKITFVDNDGDGDYDIAVITKVTPAKVTYASATEIIAGTGTYKIADNDVAEGLAKGDYVTIVKSPVAEKYTIEKIDAIESTITGERTSAGQYQIDGTWYYGRANVTGTPTAGTAVKVYAVNGVIYTGASTEAATDISDLVMVIWNEGGNLTNSVKYIDANGKTTTVALSGFYTAAGASTAAYATAGTAAGKLFTVDGGKFYEAGNTVTGYGFVAGSASDIKFTGTGSTAEKIGDGTTAGTYAIADDAVIFVYNGTNVSNSKGTVLTGKLLKTLTNSTVKESVANTTKGFYTTVTGGLTRVAYAAINGGENTGDYRLPGGSVVGTNYGIIVSNAYRDSSSTVTYQLWTGSETVTVKESGNATTEAARTTGKVLTYDTIADGKISGVAVADTHPYAVKGLLGSEISFDGTNTYKLTSDTVYLYIDSSASAAADKGKTSGTLALATQPIDGVYVQNVLAGTAANTPGSAITVIVVDVKDNIASFATKYTVSETDSTAAGVTATVGVTSAYEGQTLTATIENTNNTQKSVTVTLGNAKFADATTTKTVTVAANATATVEFIVTGQGAVTVNFR